jgi:hypothetical protein
VCRECFFDSILLGFVLCTGSGRLRHIFFVGASLICCILNACLALVLVSC